MLTGLFLLVMLVLGQTMAFIDYDFAVRLGLQEHKDVIGPIGVAFNKGFGVGDTVVYIPLLLTGLIGLWRQKDWGFFAMTGALAITAYWPVACWFFLVFARGKPGFRFESYLSYSILLGSFTLYALWGLGYLYRNRKTLAKS
ncbi:MAG TPA: hypothetical protein PKL97_06605 [Candidatus Omnitrophota bacterium]|nr:hypothetical protein [Candidatus Omnitrophota bacterium]